MSRSTPRRSATFSRAAMARSVRARGRAHDVTQLDVDTDGVGAVSSRAGKVLADGSQATARRMVEIAEARYRAAAGRRNTATKPTPSLWSVGVAVGLKALITAPEAAVTCRDGSHGVSLGGQRHERRGRRDESKSLRHSVSSHLPRSQVSRSTRAHAVNRASAGLAAWQRDRSMRGLMAASSVVPFPPLPLANRVLSLKGRRARNSEGPGGHFSRAA